MEKIERLVNLIALLRNTRRFLSVAEIRAKIPGYHGQGDEAFHRMFERDKAEIRELGYTIEQQEEGLDAEHGYRIARGEPIAGLQLTPGEMTALSLAAQAWGDRADGTLGVLKLSVGSGAGDPGPTAWMLPRVAFDETVARLAEAIQRRKVVRFTYRTGGGGEAVERIVEPHGLAHRGDWYLTGFDRTKGDVRRFKLARVVGKVVLGSGSTADFEPPAEADLRVIHGPWEGDDIAAEALVAFAPESAWWVERRTGARRADERDDGWVEIRLPVADVHSFAGWIAGFGEAAVVLEPDELRDAVVAHLRAVGEP